MVVRDRLSAELAAQTVAFIAGAYRASVKFWTGEKKKKIFAQTRARCISPVKFCRNAGSVGKFSIYQLVERLTQRRDNVIAPEHYPPVQWLFSEFICR